MLLHEDKELFREVIISTSEELGIVVPIIEKDYYVTMILRQLTKRKSECVFKGGTSLSKCHHVIDRFSEDIDITFSDKLTQGMRKKLKNDIILGISNELGMPILNFENTRSRRDYNCYTFSYDPIDNFPNKDMLFQGVKMEVSLGSTSFPTVRLPVESYVYNFLKKDNIEIINEYELQPFEMNVQSIERTFIDKIFAICDYYLQGRIKRYSRHIYDIYMLFPYIEIDENFMKLIDDVRYMRAAMSICPSAKEGINISDLLHEIVEKNVYKKDYEEITIYFQNNPVDYESAISVLSKIADKHIFG